MVARMAVEIAARGMAVVTMVEVMKAKEVAAVTGREGVPLVADTAAVKLAVVARAAAAGYMVVVRVD